MRNTKIETFTDSWNPVQGCLNGCRYCFASVIARRFGGHRDLDYYMCQEGEFETGETHVLDAPMRDVVTKEAEPYPFGFDPTYCRFRLKQPADIKRPGNIFVCSMGDLFAPWIPDEWIEEIMQVASSVAHHNYCFLTKFPDRYNQLPSPPENFLFGATIDTNQRMLDTLTAKVVDLHFLSIEPLLEHIDLRTYFESAVRKPEWVIVGPENGKAPGHVDTKREWMEAIQDVCEEYAVPLYMKKGSKTKNGSTYTKELMGDKFVQEFHPLLLNQINNTSSASAHR